MVKIRGRMAVNVIHGRNGQFSVATLYSDIGDFVIRYDGLDQYDAGTYEGEFVVRDTDIRIRPFGVGKIIEPVAFLEDLTLFEVDEHRHEPIPDAIPDPVEEETPAATPGEPAAPQQPEKQPAATGMNDGRSEGELQTLFGEAWPLRDQVKLDPTVGRTTLRAQTTHLKFLGYKYDAKEQVWLKHH